MVLGRVLVTGSLLAAMPSAARAEPDDAAPSTETAPQTDRVTPSYLVDGGAVMFFWAPIIGTMVVDSYVQPRTAPLLFDPSEGGLESRKGGEIPGVALTAGGVAVIGGMVLGDDPSRYYHAKGMAESLATSGFVAVSAKRLFGRHRPDYDPAVDPDDGSRSFPSGHSTRALSVLTYSALYLRYHGFDQWREPGTWPWWEVATYAGIGTLAVGLTGERVYHHRHHVGDVVAGGLLGAASSSAFFYFQESRYRSAKKQRPRKLEHEPGSRLVEAKAKGSTGLPALINDPTAEQPSLPAISGPALTIGGTF
jgi:hypothetical protein